MNISSTEEIIEEFRLGHMVVVMDDEDRENEGDIIIPATACTAESINFMAQYGRGLICLALSRQRCNQLNLHLMVDKNRAPFSTAFTYSIEAATGVTTGISAADRARTVQVAVAPDAKPTDIVQPGHMFPLMALDGGVLVRTGHTEASTDFARLAGLEPAAVICEIMNEDGSMARRSDLEKFCEYHNLKLGTVANLVEYRMTHETTVNQISCCDFPTEFGNFKMVTFQDSIDKQIHFALIHGDIAKHPSPLVRVHLNDYFSDVLCSDRSRKQSFSIHDSLKYISQNTGVVLVLNNHIGNDTLLQTVKKFEQEDQAKTQNESQPTAPRVSSNKPSKRVGLGSQILKKLGIKHMRILSTQTKYHGLSGYGLIIDQVINKI
ncbi:MAG: 3,4-dihydroxy-2-butanone-4-phosphate synthase [Succinivibrionaceae bacterium]|nr:3,4-dihydroxy-2-butanone-4-phosphate synthase [Succinivibrionaceae bacterium]